MPNDAEPPRPTSGRNVHPTRQQEKGSFEYVDSRAPISIRASPTRRSRCHRSVTSERDIGTGILSHSDVAKPLVSDPERRRGSNYGSSSASSRQSGTSPRGTSWVSNSGGKRSLRVPKRGFAARKQVLPPLGQAGTPPRPLGAKGALRPAAQLLKPPGVPAPRRQSTGCSRKRRLFPTDALTTRGDSPSPSRNWHEPAFARSRSGTPATGRFGSPRPSSGRAEPYLDRPVRPPSTAVRHGGAIASAQNNG